MLPTPVVKLPHASAQTVGAAAADEEHGTRDWLETDKLVSQAKSRGPLSAPAGPWRSAARWVPALVLIAVLGAFATLVHLRLRTGAEARASAPAPDHALEPFRRHPPEFADLPREAAASGLHVIMVIFAGRGDRMRVLLAYVDALLDAGALQEVHIWDQSPWASQSEWLAQRKGSRGYRYFSNSKGWNRVYRFYAEYEVPAGNKSDEVVIVKCDDDIVFIDTQHFAAFTSYTARRQDLLLVHANIVNNGVAAYYQFNRAPLNRSHIAPFMRVYPKGGGWGPLWDPLNRTTTVTYAVHRLFMSQPSAFRWGDPEAGACIDYRPPHWGVNRGQGRFSINFFAARLSSWRILHRLIEEDSDGNDEHALTTGATEKGHKECLFTPFNVVHLAFAPQFQNLELIPDYARIAKDKGLSLPAHPAPGCETGVHGMDHPFEDLAALGPLTFPECQARCQSQQGCRGFVYIRRGCGESQDACYLKRSVFPVTRMANPCHCVMPVRGRSE